MAGNPAQVVGMHGVGKQPGMIVPLRHVQRVGRHVLARHVPGIAVAVAAAADADALALPQRVERQADVLADGLAVRRPDRAGLGRQVAVEEVAKRPLADEADAGGIFLPGVGQADLGGDLAHARLGHLAQREQRAGELRLVQAVQEVALVLGVVERLEQLEAATRLAHAGVVAGGDRVRTQRHGVVEEGLELDLGIAQHIRVGRAAGGVFAQEVGEHAVLVFGGKVDRLDVHADQVGHRHHVDPVLAGRAVLAVVIVFPVLHEQADDLVALLLEQPRRDGGIHPAGHADDHALAAHCAASWPEVRP